jgi:hypothetical protein
MPPNVYGPSYTMWYWRWARWQRWRRSTARR